MSGNRSELARTRLDLQVPRGAELMVGDRRTIGALIASGDVRAVGQWRTHEGQAAIPVVYVSKRATPWYVRHRIALVATGVPLTIAGGIGALIIMYGWAWFVAGLFLAVLAVGGIVRLKNWAGGGTGRGSVTVTTTTTVRVKR